MTSWTLSTVGLLIAFFSHASSGETAPSGDSLGPVPAEELVGLWAAERLFGEPLNEELVIRKSGAKLSASIESRKIDVTHDGARVSFSLRDNRGRFRGWLDEDGSLRGHWIQPATDQVGYPVASPLEFVRQGDAWKANVATYPDRLRLYLRVQKTSDGPVTAFIRNPERNRGVWIGIRRVTVDGERVTLTGTEGRRLLTGQLRDKNSVLSLPLPFAGDLPFEFRRVGRESDFYPSKASAAYRYVQPKQLSDGWRTAACEELHLDRRRLEALAQSVRDTQTTSLATPYIHSILIARKGKLVFEEYFYGYDRDHPHDTRSAGKSVASMLVGAVIDHHSDLDVDRTVASIFGDQFSEPQSESRVPLQDRRQWRKRITIGHALSMQSGLDADDNDPKSLGGEDRMQDQSDQVDWVAYALAIPMAREPGTKAVYGSNNINLAAATVARATKSWLPDLFAQHLAAPLGIRNYYFNLDPAGHGYMGGGIRLTARDQLKLGQVMLDGGKFNGKQVLSQEWVAKSLGAQGGIHEPNDYGLGWWRKSLTFKERTVDVVYASGNGGQFIVCVPEFDLVVQMSGGNYNNFPVWYRNLTHLIPEFVFSAIEKN